MFSTRDIVSGVGLPVVLSAIVLLIAWRPWRGASSPSSGQWGGPIALAGSFVVAFVGINREWPRFPPRQITDWLPFITLAVGIVATADSIRQASRAARWSIAFATIAIVIWLLLRPLPAETTSLAAKLGWLAVLAPIGCFWWLAADELASERAGADLPRDMLIASAVNGLVLMMSGSSLLGQLSMAVAASLAVFVVIGTLGQNSPARSTVLVLATLTLALLICGHFYASLTGWNATLLFASVMMTLAGRVRPVSLIRGWKRAIVQVGLVLLPAGIALILAALEFTAAMSGQPGGNPY